ncbi:MAG: SCO family protein [Gallionellaceae bacterium]|nr:SCO family protein [Gallionellaceae bacterium]
MKYHDLILILSMMAAGGAVATPASQAQATGESRHEIPANASSYRRSFAFHRIPDVKMVDMNGSQFSLREGLHGDEPVLLNFIFTRCAAICPQMSATFRHVQEKLGKNRGKVRMVSIFIDPENDTPARLREYAEKYQAGPQWHMLTGNVEDSIAIQRAFGAFRGGSKPDYSPVTFIRAGGADKTWVRLDGLASASDIIREYRMLAGS